MTTVQTDMILYVLGEEIFDLATIVDLENCLANQQVKLLNI
ncbi:hypothetical protein [Okeania sp. SIO3B5]|nr:hypothetical protein [Okeania sp. SIO3B5]